MGLCGQSHGSTALPWKKTRYSFCRRLGWPQGRVLRLQKVSHPTGIRSQNRPARRKSLYRLRYPLYCKPLFRFLYTARETSRKDMKRFVLMTRICHSTKRHVFGYVFSGKKSLHWTNIEDHTPLSLSLPSQSVGSDSKTTKQKFYVTLLWWFKSK
jgi:hypothetical protein